jgi:hypothetical protein
MIACQVDIASSCKPRSFFDDALVMLDGEPNKFIDERLKSEIYSRGAAAWISGRTVQVCDQSQNFAKAFVDALPRASPVRTHLSVHVCSGHFYDFADFSSLSGFILRMFIVRQKSNQHEFIWRRGNVGMPVLGDFCSACGRSCARRNGRAFVGFGSLLARSLTIVFACFAIVC